MDWCEKGQKATPRATCTLLSTSRWKIPPAVPWIWQGRDVCEVPGTSLLGSRSHVTSQHTLCRADSTWPFHAQVANPSLAPTVGNRRASSKSRHVLASPCYPIRIVVAECASMFVVQSTLIWICLCSWPLVQFIPMPGSLSKYPRLDVCSRSVVRWPILTGTQVSLRLPGSV
jgi:hypothetical protein